ncbi:hypothetical protein U9M48_042161 [Paspalum notatum var. saurae]|uniref:Reverse transcriptase domain-containing protein n=1 Tax=Paspalum notatum var. saurae TaxID=547442 RepID=A0AAQ3UU68_PASNO
MTVASKVVRPSQTAFMPGRNIMEGVIILHKTIHELQSKKLNGVILKIDFEKAYDKVNWSFLQQTLRMKGFCQQWCLWIKKFVTGGSVGIKVNDDIGHYFQSKKGLRQGDPMSPILLNIVADMLSILIKRAKDDSQIRGIIPHLADDGLSILQYADDTIIFIDHDLEQAKNMKLLLCVFEQLSGLKINFHKSEIFCFGEAKHYEHEYAELFGCGPGSYPFRYLGIPMHFHKLRNADWGVIEDRFKHKLSTWKAKHLSYGGGLGITDLRIKNKCLLSKWLFKLLNEEGIWQNSLRNKYLSSKWDSHFWKGLLKVGSNPLKDQFLSLYNKVHYPHKTVENVFSQMPINITFRRSLVGDKLIAWHNLLAKIANVQLSNGRDAFTWELHRHGHFSVRSMYHFLMDQGTPFRSNFIWKLKIPLKIKIFLWYLHHGLILTKDNLAKRNWHESQKCCFCDSNETIEYLFFECQHAKNFWSIVHIAIGLTPPNSASHLLGHWLTCIGRNDRNLIFVGVTDRNLIFVGVTAQFGAHEMTKYLREKNVILLCRQSSEEHIGCDFEHCCSIKIKGRPSTWRARHWRSLHWRFLPTMDGEAIIDYASNYIN